MIAVSNANVGTGYDTSSLRDATIEKDDKTYHYASTSGVETGTVAEGVTEITYIYDENPTPPPVIPPVVKQGSVQVHYRNSAGEELKPSVIAVSNANVGTGYDTSSLRDATIEKDGKTYHYASTSGVETGTVAEGVTEITYIYDENPTPPPVIPPVVRQGSVQVHYRNSAGEELKPSVIAVSNANVGTGYDTSSLRDATIEKMATTYLIIVVHFSVETGTVAEGVTEITYIYDENPTPPPVIPPVVKQGSVQVHYRNSAGEELKPSVIAVSNANVGTGYDTSSLRDATIEKDGKTYHYASTSGVETGTVAEGVTEITYIYDENPTPPPVIPPVVKQGSVQVHYRNSAGEELKPSVIAVSNANVGTGYDTSSLRDATIEKDGKTYHYASTSGVETGTVAEGVTEITYIYDENPTPPPVIPPVVKQGSVQVHYRNSAGEELKPSVIAVSNANVGTGYDTSSLRDATIEKDGKTYHYASTSGVETGTVAEGVTEITYIYDENPTPPPVIPPVVKQGSVLVKYVNESGQEIKAQATVGTDVPLGTAYDTRSLRDETLTGTDGKTYRYKSTIGNEQGQVSEGTTTVTYVYKETKGSVLVKYVNESGQEIKAQATVETDVPLGTAYDTRSLRDETLTGTDGKTYRYKSTIGNEQGQVSEGTTTVTYVYKEKVQTPSAEGKGTVIVKYVDETGQEIWPSETALTNVPPGTHYDVSDKKLPMITITGPSGRMYRYKSVIGSETGQVVEGTTTIAFVYESPKGSVIVKYVDEAGHAIIPSVTAVDNEPVGRYYNISDYPRNTITDNTGRHYQLISTQEQIMSLIYGMIEEGTKEVSLVYRANQKANQGYLVAVFETRLGKKLRGEAEILPFGDTGRTYDVTMNRLVYKTMIDYKDGNRAYRLVEVVGDEKGTLQEGRQVLRYIYESMYGNLKVRYISRKTGQELAPSVTLPYSGGLYNTLKYRKDPSEFSTGLSNPAAYQTMTVDQPEIGQLDSNDMTVTYYYDYDFPETEMTGKHTINYTFNLNTTGFYYSTFKVFYKGQELTTMNVGDEESHSFVASGKLFYGEGAVGSATQAPTKEEILTNLTFEIDGIVLHGFEEFREFMSDFVEGAAPMDNIANYTPKQIYTGNTTVNLYQILTYSRGKGGWG
ncbi:hypothetical protein HMPREF9182_0680 [Streptococcus sp. oral taxon 056 str. F0418]|nr:hypothetical protein HMPREF9182_0680 [Streptococcus sp. oral taxon 056 str. F0418]